MKRFYRVLTLLVAITTSVFLLGSLWVAVVVAVSTMIVLGFLFWLAGAPIKIKIGNTTTRYRWFKKLP